MAVAFTMLGGTTTPVEAAWGTLYLQPTRIAPPSPPDQSWLMDVPQEDGARAKGKVAVFIFKGDDVYQPVRAAVVRTLRRKGLNVTASLRPVDSAAQYREMSCALDVAVYVEGDVVGEGAHQSARIRLRSGVTGQRIATATFSGPTPKIVTDVGHRLWTRVGPAVNRARTSAAHPRHRERAPLRIDASASPRVTSVVSQGA
ncbi:MAG TPA: hypothetical protein VGP07_16260 [Polyangia bacterium]